jgi:signal recognition particle subunit SRP68
MKRYEQLLEPLTQAISTQSVKKQFEEVVRVFDIILQILNEMKSLDGLSDDLQMVALLDSKISFYKANRLLYVGMAYYSRKTKESYAIFTRALEYLKAYDESLPLESIFTEKDNVSLLKQKLKVRVIQSHALISLKTSMLSSQIGKNLDNLSLSAEDLEIKAPSLFNNQDQFDASLDLRSANIIDFPLTFDPIPNKPFFFDIARNDIKFPSIEHRLEKKSLSGFISSFFGK